MARLRPITPVKLFIGILSSPTVPLEEVRRSLAAEFGPIDLSAGPWPHTFTDYYQDEMGPGLLRSFVAFDRLIDPGSLAQAKLTTNRLEQELGARGWGPTVRPVNLDPGYLSYSKIILATAKDYSHRLYIGNGIYAEVTLHYEAGEWRHWPWTYPDYQSQDYKQFFSDVRARLRLQRRGMPGERPP